MTMKKIRNIIAATALFLAFAGISTETAARDDLEQGDKRPKRAQMAATIDSLNEEVARLTEELQMRDSLSIGFMEDYVADGKGARFYDAATTDSLVDVWELQRNMAMDSGAEWPTDSVRFTSNVPDSVYINRLRAMNSFIPLDYNNTVRNFIILYSEKMSGKIGKIIGLSRYYMPIFDEIFNEYGLPEELKAMAIIESALNPTAESRAGAKGIWQFMYRTAKNYDLHIDSFVDERMDPVASARAAARYLKDSYDVFGDWSLAIASYNCGIGNVNRAIRRSGGKRGFWDIYPYLPRETRGYVPAFIGALYTLRYYKEHGIVPEATAIAPVVDTFKINKMLHFKQVTELVGVPLADLRYLNPQYRHDIVPGNEREYILKIPHDYANSFVDVEDKLYDYKADQYFSTTELKKIQEGGDGERIVYKVRSGDALSKIATRYHCTVNQIMRWNNLRNSNIRIGQTLIIYRGGNGPATSSGSSGSSGSGSTPAGSSSKTSSSGSGTSGTKSTGSGSTTSKSGSETVHTAEDGTKYTLYTVRNGDSLYNIAKKYPGVSAQNILDYNGLSSDKIKPGMKLKIPKVK